VPLLQKNAVVFGLCVKKFRGRGLDVRGHGMTFKVMAHTIEFIGEVSVGLAKLVKGMPKTSHFGPQYSSALFQQFNRSLKIACFNCAGSGIRGE
jgi:hypothetical protein